MTPEQEIQALRQQLAQVKLTNEIAVHKLQRQLTESFYSPQAFGDLVNPFQQFFDGSQLIFPLYPTRYDSRLFPSGIFLSDPQMDLLRLWARWLADYNDTAQAAIRAHQNYVIHTGFDYQAQPKRDTNPSKSLLKMCQKVIDTFVERHTWFLWEVDLLTRSIRDGEYLVRLFPQEDGVTEARIIEPEQVRAPQQTPDWFFGVHTAQDDRAKVLGYWVVYSGALEDGEYVPAHEVFHMKRNVDLAVRRGLSDFFCVMDQLRSVLNLLRAQVQGEAVRAAIAYMREHQVADLAAVQALVDQTTDYLLPEPSIQGAGGMGRQIAVEKVEPGSVIDTPAGLTMKPGPDKSAAAGIAILAAAYQNLAARWQMPYWMLSGDTGTTNFAAALTVESPWVRNCQREQKTYKIGYANIMIGVIQIAQDQGLLPEGTVEQVEVLVNAPPLIVRDPKSETERYLILHDKGILSKRSWAEKEDLDKDNEDQNMDADGDREKDDIRVAPERPQKTSQQQAGTRSESGSPAAKYSKLIQRPEK